MKIVAALLFLSVSAAAEELPMQPEIGKPSLVTFHLTFAALVAVNGLDSYSSRGKFEANPLLRAPDGTFSTQKGILLKSAVLIPLYFSERWAIRHHPGLANKLSWLNGALAGATYAVGLHNLAIH